MSTVVFFDIGDTLVHRPTVGPGKRLASALGLAPEDGRRITQLVFRERFDGPEALAARLASMFPVGDDVESIVRDVWDAQIREPEELPGASACVATVAAAGAAVGVISNIWAPYAAGFRRACPAIVSRIVTWHLSFEVGIAKPDPELYRIALGAAGAAPGDAVMIGDSVEKDVVPALALGMAAIWVPASHLGDDPSAQAPPDAVCVRDLAEAGALLETALATAGPVRSSLFAASTRAIEAQ